MSDGKHYKLQADIAKAFGVTRQTASKWMDKPDFPNPRKPHGYPKDLVQAWVERHNAENEEKFGNGDRAEKTRLECSRLTVVIQREKELLEQAIVETKKIKGLLVERSEVDTWDARRASAMRHAVESWREHGSAKHPAHKSDIDLLANRLLEALRDSIPAE